jgi:uncharacterized membrane protein
MIPDATGRYCTNCKKSVIDFTEKTDEEIQQFIIANFNQPLCARFKNTQIHRIVIDLPENIFNIRMPLWKRFLVACLIIFGISIFPFETTVAGKAPGEISFYQDTFVVAKADKKPRILKKKKRRKSRTPEFKLDNITWATLGYMPTPFPYPGISVLDTASKANHLSVIQLGLNRDQLPQKEYPGPTPYIPAEFILPSVFISQKKK